MKIDLKAVIKILIQFLLGRVDYINKTIFFVVLAILREGAAISSKDGWLEIFKEIKNLPQITFSYLFITLFSGLSN
jgi:hypothetical protein